MFGWWCCFVVKFGEGICGGGWLWGGVDRYLIKVVC